MLNTSTMSLNAEATKVGEYMGKIYGHMTTAIGISALVAALVAYFPPLTNLVYSSSVTYMICLFAPLVMIFFMGAKIRNSEPATAAMWLYSFAALEGVGISVVCLVFTGASIISAFFATTAMFAGLSIWAYTTKRDLSGWGKFLLMALIGLIVIMLFSLFIESTGLSTMISIAAVVIFSGLITFETQMAKNNFLMNGDVGNSAISHALGLYLDFLNLFMHILHLFGVRKD